jgi:hypothetical protein
MKEKIIIEIDSSMRRRLMDLAHYKNLTLKKYLKSVVLKILK